MPAAARWMIRRCVAIATVAAVLTGCTSAAAPEPSRPSTVVVSTITHTSPAPTITRTVTRPPGSGSTLPGQPGTGQASTSKPGTSQPSPGRSGTAPAAPGTPLPEAQSGSCPYLDGEIVRSRTGQRMGGTSVISVAPQPICLFYRSDGGWLAAARVFQTPTAAQAADAVNARVPIASSSPADEPAGWTGGYQTLQSGTADYPQARAVYGVSKGNRAVVVWTNQDETVKCRELVKVAIASLGW